MNLNTKRLELNNQVLLFLAQNKKLHLTLKIKVISIHDFSLYHCIVFMQILQCILDEKKNRL